MFSFFHSGHIFHARELPLIVSCHFIVIQKYFQDASLSTTSTTTEMTLLTMLLRHVKLVLYFVPQLRVDCSGRLTPRTRSATSKAPALGDEQLKIEFLETENVDL